MLDVTFNKPVGLYLRYFACFSLLLSCICICFCAWRLAYPWWLASLFILSLCLYSYYAFSLVLWRKRRQSIIHLRLLSKTELMVRCLNGRSYQGQLGTGCLITEHLSFLRFCDNQSKFKATFMLESTALSNKDYRELARWVNAGTR